MVQRTLALAFALLGLALVACSDDHDDGAPGAAAVTTTSTTAGAAACDDVPRAADGTEAEIVGTSGDVVLAVVDHGASVEVVSLFRGCPPAPLRLDGAPTAFPVGGTVTHGDGLACRDGGIEVLSATSDDGSTYQTVTRHYELDGDDLVLVDEVAGTIEADEEPDALRAHYEISCPNAP